MPNDIVRASATALPNSSRRAALGLFASASTAILAFAAGAPAAAAVAASDDAELLDLIRIWDEKAALTAAASRLHSETDEQEYRVPRPSAILQTEQDVAIGLSEPNDVGNPFGLGDVQRFRDAPDYRYDYRPLVDADGAPSKDAHVIMRVTLSEAIRARAKEVVAAYDEWVAALEQTKAASGAQAIEQAFHEAIDVEDAALWDVTATPANTLAGVVAKARAAQRHLHKSGEATFDGMIEDGRLDVIGPVDVLLVSIANDLLNLFGSSANA
jgi:hypothetical protein